MTSIDVHLDLIDHVRVAAPCPVKWDELEGDGATRHCRQCNLNVHNFSEMTRADVESLLRNRDARLCGAFYRRADGTILTQDCPVGLRAIRIRTAKMLSRVAAAVSLLVAGGAVLGRGAQPGDAPRLRGVQPFAALSNLIAPNPPPMGVMAMGEMIVSPTAPAPAGGTPACGAPAIDETGATGGVASNEES